MVELSLPDVSRSKCTSFITGFTFSRKFMDDDGNPIIKKSQFVFVGCVKDDNQTGHNWRIYEIIPEGDNPGLHFVSSGSFNFLGKNQKPLAFHAFESKVDLSGSNSEAESEIYLAMTTEEPAMCYILKTVEFGEYGYPKVNLDVELVKYDM